MHDGKINYKEGDITDWSVDILSVCSIKSGNIAHHFVDSES